MNFHDNDPLHAAINAKLAAIVKASPTTPAWHDAWTELGPESTEEERLAVYQAVRDSGCLPAEAGFYLVSWQIDAMASQDAEVSRPGRPHEAHRAGVSWSMGSLGCQARPRWRTRNCWSCTTPPGTRSSWRSSKRSGSRR